MLRIILLAAAISIQTPATPTFRLICVESQHGECSNEFICQKHLSKNTLLKITLPEIVRITEAQGTVQKCILGSCGETTLVNARESKGGGWAVHRSPKDSILIDGQTGFFTQATIINGPGGGVVGFAFGTCKRD